METKQQPMNWVAQNEALIKQERLDAATLALLYAALGILSSTLERASLTMSALPSGEIRVNITGVLLSSSISLSEQKTLQDILYS